MRFLDALNLPAPEFQCSSASRKFLNLQAMIELITDIQVSVLFSEPKISQSSGSYRARIDAESFSALQRAENFSM